MGITEQGYLSALTNYPFTGKSAKGLAQSRAKLVASYLKEEPSSDSYLEWLRNERQRFENYHLIYRQLSNLNYYSNATDTWKAYHSGIHILSNTSDELSYHQEKRAEVKLKSYLQDTKHLDLDELIIFFRDPRQADRISNYPAD